jgi:orotidine-5'-phosphate decarboxylase
MNPEIITAMDVSSSQDMTALLDTMPKELTWCKLGLELFCAEGPDSLIPLKKRGKNIFLDLKLHDIPHTVAQAVRSAARHNIQMLTLHASGGREMLAAAAKAAAEFGNARPKLLAVTVLTSLDENDFTDLGITRSPLEQVTALANLAISAGIDGLVCSAREVGALRKELGPTPLLVTPGIRLPSGTINDQKRVATPADAARDGATHLVIGRPITQSSDPTATVTAIHASIEQGMLERDACD